MFRIHRNDKKNCFEKHVGFAERKKPPIENLMIRTDFSVDYLHCRLLLIDDEMNTSDSRYSIRVSVDDGFIQCEYRLPCENHRRLLFGSHRASVRTWDRAAATGKHDLDTVDGEGRLSLFHRNPCGAWTKIGGILCTRTDSVVLDGFFHHTTPSNWIRICGGNSMLIFRIVKKRKNYTHSFTAEPQWWL